MGAYDNGDFLPTNYEPPKSGGGYMKFEDGDNEFRILSSPLIGWEYWDKVPGGSNKPVRLPYTEENGKTAALMASRNVEEQDQKAKHFWAMKVWDYSAEEIRILQVNQKGIQEALRNYAANKKWGSPVGRYDITVTKSGQKQETAYTVMASPHSDTSEVVASADKSKFVDLEALFYCADPFDSNWKETCEAYKASLADTF